jgi:hypothetical protein
MVAPSYEYIRAYRKCRDTAKERNGHAGYASRFITTGEQYGQGNRILKSVESGPLSRTAACGKPVL